MKEVGACVFFDGCKSKNDCNEARRCLGLAPALRQAEQVAHLLGKGVREWHRLKEDKGDTEYHIVKDVLQNWPVIEAALLAVSERVPTINEGARQVNCAVTDLGAKNTADTYREPADAPSPRSATAPTCEWLQDSDGIWHTGCGQAWTYTDSGTPKDHGAEFCYHCGGTLKANQHKEEYVDE